MENLCCEFFKALLDDGGYRTKYKCAIECYNGPPNFKWICVKQHFDHEHPLNRKRLLHPLLERPRKMRLCCFHHCEMFLCRSRCTHSSWRRRRILALASASSTERCCRLSVRRMLGESLGDWALGAGGEYWPQSRSWVSSTMVWGHRDS